MLTPGILYTQFEQGMITSLIAEIGRDPNMSKGPSSNLSRNTMGALVHAVYTSFRKAGYNQDDIKTALRMDMNYIATSTDPLNRKADRILRDFVTSRLMSGSPNWDDPSVHIPAPPMFQEAGPDDMNPSMPKKPSDEEGDDDDGDQDQDQDHDDDDDGESSEEPDQDQSPEPSPDQGQGQSDDDDNDDRDDDDDDNDASEPEPDLIRRIIRHNIEHPDNVLNILLYGPRGTAKTRMAIEATIAEFHENPTILTAPQDKYEIIGYADANGNPVETSFIRGYVRPGVILIDEIDRADQTAAIALNSAISNGLLDTTFMGVLERDPRMTVIATANTSGMGADDEYVTANVMDASIRDRFVFIPVSWDHGKAMAIADGDLGLVDFIERWNRACDSMGMGAASASYRAILSCQALRDMDLPWDKVLDLAILKGTLTQGDLQGLMSSMDRGTTPLDNALEEVCGRRA